MYFTHPSSGWRIVSGPRRVVSTGSDESVVAALNGLIVSSAIDDDDSRASVVHPAAVAVSVVSPAPNTVVGAATVVATPVVVKVGRSEKTAAGPSRPSPRDVEATGRPDVVKAAPAVVFRWRSVAEIFFVLLLTIPPTAAGVVGAAVVVVVVMPTAVNPREVLAAAADAETRCRPRNDTATLGRRGLWLGGTGVAGGGSVGGGGGAGPNGGGDAGSGSCSWGSRAMVRRASRGGGDSSTRAEEPNRKSSTSSW
jgi:hypothetical protein